MVLGDRAWFSSANVSASAAPRRRGAQCTRALSAAAVFRLLLPPRPHRKRSATNKTGAQVVFFFATHTPPSRQAQEDTGKGAGRGEHVHIYLGTWLVGAGKKRRQRKKRRRQEHTAARGGAHTGRGEVGWGGVGFHHPNRLLSQQQPTRGRADKTNGAVGGWIERRHRKRKGGTGVRPRSTVVTRTHSPSPCWPRASKKLPPPPTPPPLPPMR